MKQSGKVAAPSPNGTKSSVVVGYFIAAINILFLSSLRVSRETDNRPAEEKTRELPIRASSTCSTARGFHCHETIRFSRLVSVLLSVLAIDSSNRGEVSGCADSNLVLERGLHSREHNGLRRRMEGRNIHTRISAS